jgi:hypothetical protein
MTQTLTLRLGLVTVETAGSLDRWTVDRLGPIGRPHVKECA